MANKRLLLRRGDSAAHSTFTGVEGEITYVTDSKELRLHDGVTAGGTSFASGKPPAGAAGAIQSTDGSGEFTDSGLTITSSTLTSAISFAKSLTIGSSQSPVENLFMNNADIGGLTLQVVNDKLQLDGEDILRSSDLVSSSTISAGTIRISTSAESTAGTDDLTAMTPLKVKTVVDASVNAALTGGVQYQGTFDPSTPSDLSNALKGDLYIISGTAATYQGQSWALGDHLLVNDDMGGTLDSAKIDKVDNTDAVTSVNGNVGAVSVDLDSVLTAGSTSSTGITLQSGATITNMTPGTVLTGKILTSSGNLQLQGTSSGIVEVLGTDNTVGAIKINCEQNSHGITIKSPEHSAGASYTLTLPTTQATAGQFLQSTANGTLSWGTASTATAISELTDVDLTATTLSAGQVLTYNDTDENWVNTTLALSADNFNVQVIATETAINDPGKGSLWVYYSNGAARTMTLPTASSSNAGGVIKITSTHSSAILSINGNMNIIASGAIGNQTYAMIPRSTISFISNGLNWALVSVEEDSLDSLTDVDVSGAVATNVLKYDGANWVDGSVAYSEVTGTPSLATVATTGDYSDLNDSVVVQQFNATATASAISSSALHVFKLYGAGGFTLTLSNATAVSGFALFNNTSSSDVIVDGATFRANGEGWSGGSSSITVKPGERRLFHVYLATIYMEVNSTLIGHNADVTITSPSNGEALIYNSTSGDWENGTVSASVAALDDIGDVDTTGAVATNVLKYDGANWVDGSVAYSEVTDAPDVPNFDAIDISSDTTLSGSLKDGCYLIRFIAAATVTIPAYPAGRNLVFRFVNFGVPTCTVHQGSRLYEFGDSGISTQTSITVDSGVTRTFHLYAAAQSLASNFWFEANPSSTTGGGSAPSVTVPSPPVSGDQILSAPSGIEEIYIYTPTTDITVNLVAAATCGSGFKYQIKNRSTNTITIDPNGSEKIDGAETFDLSVQEASVTLITDGSNWFII